MTDRLKGCFVVFDQDIRSDDADPLLDAIRQLRGVAGVEVNVADADDWMNRKRIRLEMEQRLLRALDDKKT